MPGPAECIKKRPRSAVNYSRYLKLNNIAPNENLQYIVKVLFVINFGFKSKFSCTKLILVNRRYLLYISTIYHSRQREHSSPAKMVLTPPSLVEWGGHMLKNATGCKTASDRNTSQNHNGINIFKIPKAKSGIPEYIK